MFNWFKRWILQDRFAQGVFEAERMIKKYGFSYAYRQYKDATQDVGLDDFDKGFKSVLEKGNG